MVGHKCALAGVSGVQVHLPSPAASQVWGIVDEWAAVDAIVSQQHK